VPAGPPEMKMDFYGRLYKTIREGEKVWVKPEEVYEQMRVNALARKGTKFEFKD
jgi:hypothetical protein